MQSSRYTGGMIMVSDYGYGPALLHMAAVTLLLTVLWVYSWHRRNVPAAAPFLVLLISVIAWVLLAGTELTAIQASTKILCFKAEGVAMLLVATADLCFTLEYAAPGKWLTHRNLALLAVPIGIYTLLGFVTGVGHLLWSSFQVDARVHPSNEVILLAMAAYGVFLLLLTTTVLAGLFIRSPLHRWPIGLMLIGGLPARVIAPLHLTGVMDDTIGDPLILAYSFALLTFFLALYRFRALDIVPLARDTVFGSMRDGWVVLNAHNRPAQMNRTAARFLGEQALQTAGSDRVETFLRSQALLQVGAPHPFEVKDRAGQRRYEVGLVPLTDRHGLLIGRLVLLHDVTETRRAQERVMQQQRALAVLQEQEREARDVHDGPGQVLVYIRMQAEAARGLLAQGQSEMVGDYLSQLISIAQDASANIREQSAVVVSSDIPDPPGFAATLQLLARRLADRYGIAIQLNVPPGWDDTAVKPVVGAQLLSMIQEALSNAGKHARCNCVRVDLNEHDGQMHVTVEDDGVGFDPAQAPVDDSHGFGLALMRERARDTHISVQVHAAPGRGTQIGLRALLRAAQPGEPV